MSQKRPSDDTISAIATAPGRGGIGVIRISGPIVSTIAFGILGKIPEARKALLARFIDKKGETIDQGIALFFCAPNSYTGEDVLELQGHGGPAVLQNVLARCLELGARLARPGEFTQRAYLNEKMDLAQAESVADLIDAATTQAAKSAMRSLQGEFSRHVHDLVAALINLRMLIESTLDFPEEELEFLQASQAKEKLKSIRTTLTKLLGEAKQGKLLSEGLQIVLIGRPNVGKSSLINRLAREEVAIVTPMAGTTRDTVRQEVQLDGLPIHIIDTAGLRETTDSVEQIGIARTWKAVEKSDIALVIIDAVNGLGEDDKTIIARIPKNLPIMHVYNKADLLIKTPKEKGLYISAKTGQGIEELQQQILKMAGWQQTGEDTFIARERHVQALLVAEECLNKANLNWDQLELFAEELTQAQKALSGITGEFTADDLLGEIFSRFCIGK